MIGWRVAQQQHSKEDALHRLVASMGQAVETTSAKKKTQGIASPDPKKGKN